MVARPALTRKSLRGFTFLRGICALATVLVCAGGPEAFSAEAWEAEWNRTLALAKKEGTVSLALGGSATRETRPVWEAFQKKFGIRVLISGGSGSKVTSRILAERTAGRTEVDLVSIGVASTIRVLIPNKIAAPMDPLLFLPEVTDRSKWFGGKHWYGDPDEKYLMLYSLAPDDSGIAINTNLVNEDDLKSYWDIFDPRYDGKRVSGLMTLAQGANTVGDMMMLVGPEWITRWVRSKPIFLGETEVAINYLIEGRAAIGMFLSGELQTLDGLREKGAPVKRITRAMKEGRSARGSGVVAITNPPHPNAQKLLVNWFLSREGQLLIQKSNDRYNSPREDIPKDMLARDVLRTPGEKYALPSQNPEYSKMVKEGIELVRKLRSAQ